MHYTKLLVRSQANSFNFCGFLLGVGRGGLTCLFCQQLLDTLIHRIAYFIKNVRRTFNFPEVAVRIRRNQAGKSRTKIAMSVLASEVLCFELVDLRFDLVVAIPDDPEH